MKRLYLLSIGLLLTTEGYAQSEVDRSKMIDSFLSYRKSGNSIYLPPPITHMVPNFNTITYALAYEKRNITVLPRDDDGDLDENNKSSLSMKGYTVAPHLAISLKKVGIGFSIENSKNTSTFDYPYGNGNGSRQQTTVSASGLGFNLSALPFESLRKTNKLAVIIGGKSLNVRHEYTDFLNYNATSEQTKPTAIRYNLLKYEVGANLTIQLLKQFSIIPWLDYSRADTGGALEAYNEEKYGANTSDLYADDVKLYWQSFPNLRYGIDMGINVFGLDIRIGSFLGSLARLNSQPDYIKDSSFSLSISFDQKGG